MAQAQSGICAEANLHGLHLFFNVFDGQDESLRAKLKQVSAIEEEFNDQFSESMLSCVVQSAPFTHKNWLGDQWI